MALLSKAQILAADDLPTRDVKVPEWGGSVRVRTLSGTERDQFEADSMKGKGKNRDINLANMRARLVAATCVYEDGTLMFDEPSDVIALGRKSAAALDRVYTAAAELSGITDADMEELAEDFTGAPNEPSTTD
ncbi:hypothetical protein GCM10027160_28930 [Streptomyces calidiresistens]|uniref:Tail assembly chaperone n=1 Tax=Streptomyces calidiresistens TaxID=1485586 RepID=A0A7W3T078_9ACTN|nr:hypothetical protein [Streptomyces calidiresistens]MBB0228512.1 hypothetical protein [Streptomyces calidiresistens]